MNGIARPLKWLLNGLGLNDPDLPTILDTTVVLPVIDVGQGGHGSLVSTFAAGTHGPSVATANVLEIPDSDLAHQLLIHAVHVTHVGGAAGLDATLAIIEPNAGTFPIIQQINLAVGQVTSTIDWLGGSGPFWIPPGYGFRLRLQTTGAGETMPWRVLYSRLRSGYNPL